MWICICLPFGDRIGFHFLYEAPPATKTTTTTTTSAKTTIIMEGPQEQEIPVQNQFFTRQGRQAGKKINKKQRADGKRIGKGKKSGFGYFLSSI